jgi:hypothetical protein
MSDRNRVDAAAIHDRALRALGLERSLALRGVARDLRSGRIEHRRFHMGAFGRGCGTPCCVWGHVMEREGVFSAVQRSFLCEEISLKDPAFINLTLAFNPSDPVLAADAIERYVLEGSDDPWRANGDLTRT